MKHWGAIVKRKSKFAFVGMNIHVSCITDFLPTLCQVLTEVPVEVGFDIEIKYPANKKELEQLSIKGIRDINAYVDTILSVVFDHAATRRIVFSCFSPDVCLLLRAKQTRFHVMFLTEAPLDDPDLRVASLEVACQFVTFCDLQGLVCDSKSLQGNASVLDKLIGRGRMVWTYGAMNNKEEWNTWQYARGVSAVITDLVQEEIGKSPVLGRSPVLKPRKSPSLGL